MKKLMVLTAMLAMMLAMATPAFAQGVTAIDEGDDVEYNAAGQNIVGSVGNIDTGNTATQTVTATGDSAASGSISQGSGVTLSQSNEVGNGFFHPFFWNWLF